MSTTMTTPVRSLEVGALARPEKATRPLSNYWKALVPILAGVALLFVPIPEGITANAWYYFALFVAVVIALILEPIPAAAVLSALRRPLSHYSLCLSPPTPSSGRSRDFRTVRFG